MRRGTTPTVIITIDADYDVSQATDIWVTLEQQASGTELTREWKRNPDPDDPTANRGISVSGQIITVTLSQEETLGFIKGSVQIQVKLKQDDSNDDTIYDEVVGTVIKKLKIDEILNEDVM